MVKVSACTGRMFATCYTEHSDKQQITDVPTVKVKVPWLGARLHGQVAADGDGGRRAIIRRRRLPTVAGCAINDGDGDDMLWMQLVKVGKRL